MSLVRKSSPIFRILESIGEMIGVEYLFNQTGEILKDNTLEDEDMMPQGEEPLSDVNLD